MQFYRLHQLHKIYATRTFAIFTIPSTHTKPSYRGQRLDNSSSPVAMVTGYHGVESSVLPSVCPSGAMKRRRCWSSSVHRLTICGRGQAPSADHRSLSSTAAAVQPGPCHQSSVATALSSQRWTDGRTDGRLGCGG